MTQSLTTKMRPQFPTKRSQRMKQIHQDLDQQQEPLHSKGDHMLHHPQGDPFPQHREEQLITTLSQDLSTSSLQSTNQPERRRPHLWQRDPHRIPQMNRQILTHQTPIRKTPIEMFSSHREEVNKAVPMTVLSTMIRNKRTRAKTQVKARITPARMKQRTYRMTSPMMTVAHQG